MNKKNNSISLLAYPLSMMLLLCASCSQEKKDIASQTPASEQTPAAVEMPNATSATPAPEISHALPSTNPSPATKPTPAKPVVSEGLSLQSDGTVQMKVGQSAKISSSMSLDYVRVVSDSRCPAGAQCIWAGEVTIEFKLHSGSDQQSFNLTDHTTTTNVMGMKIELLSIDRANLASIKVSKI